MTRALRYNDVASRREVDMTTQEFNVQLQRDNHIAAGSPAHEFMHKAADEARKTTALINGAYHTDEELRALMSRLVGYRVDDGFRLFPPVYTDFGKNIKIGKDVFVNSGCCFQDQGGVTLGDGCLVGHNVVFATLDHDKRPGRRGDMTGRRRDRRRRRGRDKGRAAKHYSSRGAGAGRQNDWMSAVKIRAERRDFV